MNIRNAKVVIEKDIYLTTNVDIIDIFSDSSNDCFQHFPLNLDYWGYNILEKEDKDEPFNEKTKKVISYLKKEGLTENDFVLVKISY